MNLSSGALTIELQPRRTVDDEDWVRVQVVVGANGFRGDFEAWLQLADLSRFRDELEDMHQCVGQEKSAVLASAEPDIEVRLDMQQLGQIHGRYAFESERVNGQPTVLSGSFEIDQSYLPRLRTSVDSLIWQLGGASTE
jgi:hypothetical protein